MAKIYLTLVFAVFLSAKAYSASSVFEDSTRTQKAKVAVGLLVGTTGLGIEFTYALNQKNTMFLKGAISNISYAKVYNFEYNTKSIIKVDPDLRLGISYIGLDYLPFPKSSFYLTSGLSYLYDFKSTIFADTKTGLDISGTFISAEDFGKINFEVKWNKVAPFVGFGFGRAVPKKRIGLGLEMGVYYIGSPKLFIEYTGLLDITNIDEALPKIEKNMAGYAYLPYLNFKLKYRIR
ncbi:MAG: hypothetical protein V4585_13550 [Bacteroidota bacterium]